MTETPDQVYGRLSEALHVVGYTFERAWQRFEWLLDEERWKRVGSGYSDINDFLATIQLPKGATVEQRAAVAKKIKALQPEASQRKIAGVLGVSNETVRRDLGVTSVTPLSPTPAPAKAPPPMAVTSVTPEPTGEQVAAQAKKAAESKAKRVEREQEETAALAEAQATIGEEKRRSLESVCDLRVARCRDLLASGVKPDAVITDPPYPRDFLPVFSELAEACKDVPVVAVMVGQSYLPDVLARMVQHLRYRWTLAYLTPGGQAVQQWEAKVNTTWKPVLLFGEAADWFGDVARSNTNDNDKRFHGWGQSESGMADLLERLTKPGQLVCDPFLGGGTTAVVSLALGRRFVGCDIDAAAVDTTRLRVEAAA